MVALYFGSFDPLHYGHLAVAEYVITHLDVERFLFVLSPHNPGKSSEQLNNANNRLTALKREVAEFSAKNAHLKRAEVSDIEFSLPEPRYTFNTLEEFKRREPNSEFCLVVGADTFAVMEKWYRGLEVLKNYKIIVYPRAGSRVKTKCRKYKALYLSDAPLNNISSTQIRASLSK